VALLLIVSVFILVNRSASQTVRSSTFNSATGTAKSIANPLDQLSSAQIALTAAQTARLPELSAIRNQADSDSITLRVIPNDSIAVAKPQIVTTAGKSRQDIKSYVTKDGDTLSSVADKFGVNANSIKWSNSITGTSLKVGIKLVIPPVNGIVYTVKAGDTPTSLGTRYQADPSQIISYNDAEISGLTPGEQIIIPNGQVFAPVVTYTAYSYSRAGAIAQSDAGWEGHVAYVEAVSPDGTQMKYSDMNGLAGWGRVGYSDWVPANRFPHYIYH
jgi:LysM repeat protein